MSEKNEAGHEETVFQKLDRLRTEVSYHLYDIETMVKIGEEVALATTEQKNFKVEWASVFSIMGKLHKVTERKLQELEEFVTQEQIREQKKTGFSSGHKFINSPQNK